MISLIAMIAGIVFGFGLILSGMVNPAIVLAFLDVTGDWNPSLLWVMGGAITASAIAFAIARRRKIGYLGTPIQLPSATQIDKRLLLGSLLFGMGWGIAGICPGPALVLVGSGNFSGGLFVVAMLIGMGIFEIKRR